MLKLFNNKNMLTERNARGQFTINSAKYYGSKGGKATVAARKHKPQPAQVGQEG